MPALPHSSTGTRLKRKASPQLTLYSLNTARVVAEAVVGVVTRAVAEVEAIAAAAVVSTEEAGAIEVVAGPRMQEEEGEYECPRGEDRVSHPWEDSAPQWDNIP